MDYRDGSMEREREREREREIEREREKERERESGNSVLSAQLKYKTDISSWRNFSIRGVFKKYQHKF